MYAIGDIACVLIMMKIFWMEILTQIYNICKLCKKVSIFCKKGIFWQMQFSTNLFTQCRLIANYFRVLRSVKPEVSFGLLPCYKFISIGNVVQCIYTNCTTPSASLFGLPAFWKQQLDIFYPFSFCTEIYQIICTCLVFSAKLVSIL